MRRPSTRELTINLLVLLVLLLGLEGLARLAIFIKLGDSTAGLSEKRSYLNYKPFTMYGPNWDELIPQIADRRYFDGNCRVVLIGGSTAEGWTSVKIEEKLDSVLGFKSYRVVNLGVGGFNARQQAVVSALWLPVLRPHLVITLDGANDIIHRPRMTKGGTFYLNDTYNLFLSSPYLSPILETLVRSQFFNSVSAMQRRFRFRDKKEYADLVKYYMNAQQSIDSVVRGVGAKRMYVLQPFHAFKKNKSPEEASFTHYDYRKEYVLKYYKVFASRLASLSRNTGNVFLDSSEAFQDVYGHSFTDDVHLTEYGYDILGESIANVIAKERILDRCD